MTNTPFLILIKALAALSSELAGEHHALEERRCREHRVLVLIEHDVRDVVRRVEADKVEQREGAHRIAAAD